MSVLETAHVFTCGSESLVGILSQPVGTGSDTGILIIVGGPQYRIGSHRQFASLARALAAAGHAVLRFDCRGMGDSTGKAPGFDAIDADIGAAIDLLQAANPGLRRVVLWGLCDGASAALLYAWRQRDARIAGAVLANPWLHSEQAEAHAIVHSYYRQRLLDGGFWRKLLGGETNLWHKLGELLAYWRGSRRQARADHASLMSDVLDELAFPMLFLLCRRDATAQAFLAHLQLVDSKLMEKPHVRKVDFDQADHTFSRAEWRREAENVTIEWLNAVFPGPNQT